jgi:hypothetical protein
MLYNRVRTDRKRFGMNDTIIDAAARYFDIPAEAVEHAANHE